MLGFDLVHIPMRASHVLDRENPGVPKLIVSLKEGSFQALGLDNSI